MVRYSRSIHNVLHAYQCMHNFMECNFHYKFIIQEVHRSRTEVDKAGNGSASEFKKYKHQMTSYNYDSVYQQQWQ